MGKARVAPLKPATIPRMELTAATMASRMDTVWRKELQMELADSIFWTNSTSVLKYINNKTTSFRTFMANRVAEIQKVSHAQQWRYVNTTNNPADMASWGLRVESFLRKEMWLSDPDFLLQSQEEWPQNPDGLEKISPKDSEVKSITVNATQVMTENMDPVTHFIHHFSSWTHLKRAVAWILRFKRLLLCLSRKGKQATSVHVRSDNVHHRNLSQNDTGNLQTLENPYLTVEELAAAEMEIICFCQKRRFADEIQV